LLVACWPLGASKVTNVTHGFARRDMFVELLSSGRQFPNKHLHTSEATRSRGLPDSSNAASTTFNTAAFKLLVAR
jgi:hypothetical protein